MKSITVALLFSALCASSPVIYAGSLTDAPTAFTAGKWKVVKSVDPMTDETSCTGIYNNDYSIQLSQNDLFVGVRGGIELIKVRLDNDPQIKSRLPESIEKKVNDVIFSGKDLSAILMSKRLRIEVATVIDGIQYRDIDTTDMLAALDNIRAGCPINSNDKKNSQASAASTQTSVQSDIIPDAELLSGRCGFKLIDRMRAAGVTKKQINAICLNK